LGRIRGNDAVDSERQGTIGGRLEITATAPHGNVGHGRTTRRRQESYRRRGLPTRFRVDRRCSGVSFWPGNGTCEFSHRNGNFRLLRNHRQWCSPAPIASA
jgi:hypothetical protein